MAVSTIKIHQSAFVGDLIIKKELTNCNTNVIPMKAGSSIKMTDLENYNETDLHMYQKLVRKLMYLWYGIKPDIAFAIEQYSKYNTNPRKGHL